MSGELQFERAEPAGDAAGGITCVVCKKPVAGEYVMGNGKTVCVPCRGEVEQSVRSPRRYLPGLLLGSLGGAAGAAVWYGVYTMFGMEAGIVAILLGWLVGAGVRRGSGGWGGAGLQLMAMMLTYASITAAYAGLLFAEAVKKGVEERIPLLELLRLALSVPWRGDNLIGLLILAIALWEAWRQNRRVPLVFTGPYRIAPEPSAGE